MKKKVLILYFLLASIGFASASDLHLIHVKGIHSIGLRGGTALFNTWDIGLNYNYCMHRRWVWNTGVDYEEGVFGQSIYRGITVSPGVEFAVWQPCNWLFLNLTSNLNLGWDEWEHKELKSISPVKLARLSISFLSFFSL